MSTPPFPPPNTPPPPPPGGGNPYGNNPYGNNPYGNNPPYGGNPYQQNPMGMQRDLPNATVILVLGIVSIVMCWCYGIIGLGTGIASLIMGNKAMREYESNPNGYTRQSYNNAKAGRICGIIGTILSGLTILYFIFVLVVLGTSSYRYNPWDF